MTVTVECHADELVSHVGQMKSQESLIWPGKSEHCEVSVPLLTRESARKRGVVTVVTGRGSIRVANSCIVVVHSGS